MIPYKFKIALNKMYGKHTMFTDTIEETTFLETIFFSYIDPVMSRVKTVLIAFVLRNTQGGHSSTASVPRRS